MPPCGGKRSTPVAQAPPASSLRSSAPAGATRWVQLSLPPLAWLGRWTCRYRSPDGPVPPCLRDSLLLLSGLRRRLQSRLLSPVPLRSCDPDGSRTSTRGIISPPVGGGKIPPGRGVRGPPRGGPPRGPPGAPRGPARARPGPGGPGAPRRGPWDGFQPPPGGPPGTPDFGDFGGFSGARYTISSYSEGGILGGSGGVPGGVYQGGMVYHGGWILSQMAKKPKKPKIHFVPTGRVIKYPRKCTPPGPGGPPGGPPGPPDSLPPRTGIPQGVWFSPAHMVGSVSDPLTRGPLAPG